MIQEQIQDSRLGEGGQYNPWLSRGWKMLTLDLYKWQYSAIWELLLSYKPFNYILV